MKLSQIVFRISFIAFAVVYLAVIAEFFSPQQMHLEFEVRYDAIVLTAIVFVYVYIFFDDPNSRSC